MRVGTYNMTGLIRCVPLITPLPLHTTWWQPTEAVQNGPYDKYCDYLLVRLSCLVNCVGLSYFVQSFD